MSKYQHQDFLANPEKYKLFRTARISKHVLTHNGENDLPEGEIVGVSYRCNAPNTLFRRDEPVYTIIRQGGRAWGDLYANALGDFVL